MTYTVRWLTPRGERHEVKIDDREKACRFALIMKARQAPCEVRDEDGQLVPAPFIKGKVW